jgi:CDP-glucose 4,6-dehydratase
MSNFWKNQTVVISGALGFVATNLVAALLRLEATIIGIARDRKPTLPGFEGTWEEIFLEWGTVYDQRFVDRVFSKYQPTVVVHLAAQTEVGRSARDPEETFRTNVEGTYCMLEGARRCRSIKAFVYGSSDKAYGHKPRELLPYLENMPLAHDGDWYSITKSMADYCCQQYGRLYDLPIRVLRPGNIFGPGQRNATTLITATVTRLLRGERAQIRKGREDILREFVFVDDAVQAYLHIAEDVAINGHQGLPPLTDPGAIAFNVGSGARLSTMQVVSLILQNTDRHGDEIDFVPPQPNVREIGDQYLDCTKLRTRFPEWHPRSFEEALELTVGWYAQQHRLLEFEPV